MGLWIRWDRSGYPLHFNLKDTSSAYGRFKAPNGTVQRAGMVPVEAGPMIYGSGLMV